MAFAIKSLINSAKALAMGNSGSKAALNELFPAVDPAVDGEDCTRDCESCSIQYPKRFKIDEADDLYGYVKGWSTHLLVATGKSDWARDIADEKGSVMQAIAREKPPTNGRLFLSASDMPTPHHSTSYSEPTTVLLLPAFLLIDNVTPAAVPTLLSSIVSAAPTTASPLVPFSVPASLPAPLPEGSPAELAAAAALTTRACPHRALILLCSQRTRDARCGQSAPLLRREFARHLQPRGLYRDPDDERPGGVAVYFVSHVGGHKYAANVLVYRRRNAFGLDDAARPGRGGSAAAGEGEGGKGDDGEKKEKKKTGEGEAGVAEEGKEEEGDVGAAQCIWLARVRPEDCEKIVEFTVLRGKVVKPERQLRGGFDREKGLLSW